MDMSSWLTTACAKYVHKLLFRQQSLLHHNCLEIVYFYLFIFGNLVCFPHPRCRRTYVYFNSNFSLFLQSEPRNVFYIYSFCQFRSCFAGKHISRRFNKHLLRYSQLYCTRNTQGTRILLQVGFFISQTNSMLSWSGTVPSRKPWQKGIDLGYYSFGLGYYSLFTIVLEIFFV